MTHADAVGAVVDKDGSAQITLVLDVRELSLALVFYRDVLGLQVLARAAGEASLGFAGRSALVTLREVGKLDRRAAAGSGPVARLLFTSRAYHDILGRLTAAAIHHQASAEYPAEIAVRDLDGHTLLLSTAPD